MISTSRAVIYLSSICTIYLAFIYPHADSDNILQTSENENLSANPDRNDVLSNENSWTIDWKIDPEADMTVDETIQYHGYPVINYNITTGDGYILTVHRIPHGMKTERIENRRQPVVIFPGVFCSSGTWISNTKDKNLPYILADAGYDVWLGNFRGTVFGRRHESLSPDGKQFWKFSNDEMAKYDVPAIIDTMLNVTGFQQIFYVGHSMGSNIGLAMLASQPKYNRKVKAMFAFAPTISTTFKLIRSPFINLFHTVHLLRFFHNYFGTGEHFTNSKFIEFVSRTVCNSSMRILCSTVLFLFSGFNEPQLNQTRFPVYLHHTPSGTSVQNLEHFSQYIKTGVFKHFDYGQEENEIRYRQSTPPLYNVSSITTPVAIFWGENDYLAVPHDIGKLADQLQNLIGKYRVPDDKFGHLDFLWAIDAKTLVYDKLIELMTKSWSN